MRYSTVLIGLVWVGLLFLPVQAGATIYWAETNGSNTATCTAIDSTDETDPGSYGTIGRAANCATQPGDKVWIKPGTYTSTNHRINTETTTPSFGNGTALNPIIVEGVPGQARPLITLAAPWIHFRALVSSTMRNYITLRNFDFVDTGSNPGSSIFQLNGSYITLENFSADDAYNNAVGFGGPAAPLNSHHLTVRNATISNPGRDGLGYAFYVGGDDVLIDNVYAEGVQQAMQFTSSNAGVQPARITVSNSHLHSLATSGGGCNGIASEAPDTIVYNTIIDASGCSPNLGGAGIIIGYTAGATLQAYNNLIMNYKTTAINFGEFDTSGTSGHIAKNNVFYNNGSSGNTCFTFPNGATATTTHNAASASASCGTSKVTIAALTDIFVSSSDFRLKTGTNVARNAGTTVSTRPSPVGVPDIGPYEQGLVASAVVASGYIEVTVNVMTPGVLPTSDITGFTIANGTSTGTPVVSVAAVKPGASNVILLTLTGFTASGTCTLSYSAGNVTDSGYVGYAVSALAQGINTASGVSVSGTCNNSSGGAPPVTNLELHYPLDEGTGTTAIDAVAALDGTFVGSFTWLSPKGVSWAAGGSNAPLQIPYGSGIDLTSNGLTLCGTYALAAGSTNTIVAGASSTGTNDRFYFGTYSGNTWVAGVQGSSYATVGESEFQKTANETRICLAADPTGNEVVLVVNAVQGNTSASRIAITSITLAANLTVHCVLESGYCGQGLVAKDIKVWSKFLTQQEFTDDYLTFFPPGASVGGYAQKTHGWEGIYTYNGSPVSRGVTGQTAYVVAGGGIAATVQLDCTGGPCNPLAVQFHYSTDGVNYPLPIPTMLGGDGIALWGADTSTIFNAGTTTCCLTGALTANHGPTLYTTSTSPTLELAQDSSYQIRVLLRVAADKAGSTFYIKAKQDNGAELDGAATPSTGARLDVVPMAWSR